MTELLIKPRLSTKEATFKGTVAAGEQVSVKIANPSDALDLAGLRLRVVGHCGETLAQFPEPVEEGETPDSWGEDSGHATCVLDLCTDKMLAAVPPRATVEFLFVLDDAEDGVLYFKDLCPITHWPMRTGEDVPKNVRDYRDFIAEAEEAISNAQEATRAALEAAEGYVAEGTGILEQAQVKLNAAESAASSAVEAKNDAESAVEDAQEAKTAAENAASDAQAAQAAAESAKENIETPTTDLTLSGKAADAKTVGDRFAELENSISAKADTSSLNGLATQASVENEATLRGSADAAIAQDISNLSINKADKSGTYTKAQVDAIFKAVTPASIGALPSSSEDIDGYVMAFGGAQYALQTPYTQSGISGWGTADGTWRLFVAADGTVLLLKDGVAKPTNPLSVAGIPLPWSLQFNDGGLVTAVVASAGATSTEEIVGHLRSRENPHGVTKAQLGLGNVDNTSDAAKPISTATQAALNAKYAKPSGGIPASDLVAAVQTTLNAVAGKLDKSGGSVAYIQFDYEDLQGVRVSAYTPDEIHLVSMYNDKTAVIQLRDDGWRLAYADDIPYAKSSTIGTRKVLTVTATSAQSVALPALPTDDEVLNCDIVVNGTAATADFGLTLVGGTGVSVYYPDGEGITCKSGCVTMASCVGINGLGWLVVGCNNLKTAS